MKTINNIIQKTPEIQINLKNNKLLVQFKYIIRLILSISVLAKQIN